MLDIDRKKIRNEIKSFLENEFNYTGVEITDDLNLAENIYIDSINTVKVVFFLEQRYSISLSGSDLSPKNFFKLRALAELVEKKLTTQVPK